MIEAAEKQGPPPRKEMSGYVVRYGHCNYRKENWATDFCPLSPAAIPYQGLTVCPGRQHPSLQTPPKLDISQNHSLTLHIT